jgi:hypothetical protein
MKTWKNVGMAVVAATLLAMVNAGCATQQQPEIRDTWTDSANRSAAAASRAEQAAQRAEAAAARMEAAAQKVENVAGKYNSKLEKSFNK